MDSGKSTNKFKNKLKKAIVFIIVFFVCTVICLAHIFSNRSSAVKLQETILKSEADRVEYSVASLLKNLDVLEMFVIDNNGNFENFESVCKKIMSDPVCGNAVRCLELAPNGLIIYTYPEEGNEVSGVNLFENRDRREVAEWSRDTGKITFEGPYELMQGSVAAVARKPVYLENESGEKSFWGFVVELINVDEVIKNAELEAFSKQGYDYKLWYYNPMNDMKTVIASSTRKELEDTYCTTITLAASEWYFEAVPTTGWYSLNDCIGIIVTSFVFAVFITFLIARDDERKQTIRLNKERKILKNIVDNINCGVLVYEIKGKHLYPVSINSTFCNMCGIKEEDFKGIDIKDFLVNVWGAQKAEEMFENEKLDDYFNQTCEVQIENESTGNRFWCDASFRTVYEEKYRHMLYVSFNDIDDIKKAVKSAEQANAAKTEFLSKMSHDIRTPMNAIIGMTEIGLMHMEEKVKVRDCLAKIKISSQHLLALINEVLDMRKIESGSIVMNYETFDLNEFLDGVMEMMLPNAKDKHHVMGFRLRAIRHNRVYGDPVRVQQILVNLLGNAVKYTLDGGKIELSAVEKKCDREGYGLYEFTVKDNGIGMTKEFMEHIFEPFTRAEDSRTSKVYGTGLGMSIVDSLVRMMDGDIKIESELGKGSEFIVRIYLKLAEDAGEGITGNISVDNVVDDSVLKEVTADTDVSYSTSQQLSFKNGNVRMMKTDIAAGTEKCIGKRVLLVEDQEFNQTIAVEFLEMFGVKVECADDGEKGIEKFMASEEGYYDIVFMDIQMPVMNGYEATEKIRKLDRQDALAVPIIAMTANAFAEDVQAAKDAGMNEHLSKPLDINKIKEILVRWL